MPTRSVPSRPAPQSRRMQPVEAWRGLRALFANPDDTTQVFRVIRALAGKSIERGFQRFASSENGQRVLAERRSLVERLNDREYLESLPEGTLGNEYAAFTAREQISADGLIEASEEASEQLDAPPALCPDRELYATRLRDMHDLWHIVTGYQRDILGEAALLAFTYRQTRNRGIGFIVGIAYLRAGRVLPEERSMIRDGWRRAAETEWLPAADWETLLTRPLAEVRQKLRVEPSPEYKVVRSEGAPALA